LLLAEKNPDDTDLSNQPTLSHFENAISIASLKRLRDVFIEQFIASFDAPRRGCLVRLFHQLLGLGPVAVDGHGFVRSFPRR